MAHPENWRCVCGQPGIAKVMLKGREICICRRCLQNRNARLDTRDNARKRLKWAVN